MNRPITIVSATVEEALPLKEYLQAKGSVVDSDSFIIQNQRIDLIYTGIGTLQTTFHLMKYLHTNQPNGWIQMGIGGAIDLSLSMGTVFQIQSEMIYGDGAQDKDGNLINPFSLGWMEVNQPPFSEGLLSCSYQTKWPRATGITTFYAHGELAAIENLKKKAHGQIENMEGAPFFYISLMNQIPFLSFRAISNFVEPRDKSKWEISMAIQKLNQAIIQLMEESTFNSERLFIRSGV